MDKYGGLKMMRDTRPLKGWTQAEKDKDRKLCYNCKCERYNPCKCTKNK